MVPILISKDVLESSYQYRFKIHDLKLQLRLHQPNN